MRKIFSVNFSTLKTKADLANYICEQLQEFSSFFTAEVDSNNILNITPVISTGNYTRFEINPTNNTSYVYGCNLGTTSYYKREYNTYTVDTLMFSVFTNEEDGTYAIIASYGVLKCGLIKDKDGNYFGMTSDIVRRYGINCGMDRPGQNCVVEESNGNTCFLIPSLPANGSSLYTPALDTVCVLVLPIYVNTGASCIVSGEYYGIYHNTNPNYKSHIVFRYTP